MGISHLNLKRVALLVQASVLRKDIVRVKTIGGLDPVIAFMFQNHMLLNVAVELSYAKMV
jgi:hypothetical protein